MRRHNVVAIKVTDRERRRWQEAAARAEQSVSELVRTAMRERIGPAMDRTARKQTREAV
jgi:hypothetical protein